MRKGVLEGGGVGIRGEGVEVKVLVAEKERR